MNSTSAGLVPLASRGRRIIRILDIFKFWNPETLKLHSFDICKTYTFWNANISNFTNFDFFEIYCQPPSSQPAASQPASSQPASQRASSQPASSQPACLPASQPARHRIIGWKMSNTLFLNGTNVGLGLCWFFLTFLDRSRYGNELTRLPLGGPKIQLVVCFVFQFEYSLKVKWSHKTERKSERCKLKTTATFRPNKLKYTEIGSPLSSTSNFTWRSLRAWMLEFWEEYNATSFIRLDRCWLMCLTFVEAR